MTGPSHYQRARRAMLENPRLLATTAVGGIVLGLCAPQFVSAQIIRYGISIGLTWVVTEAADAAWKISGRAMNAPAMYHATEVVLRALRRRMGAPA